MIEDAVTDFPADEPEFEGRLTDEQVTSLVSRMVQLHAEERGALDRIYGYRKGQLGVPETEEGATKELKAAARLSVMNVLGMVVDSFVQNLSVIGYRRENADDNDPAWAMWQRNRMDARQRQIYDPAVTYGASYVTVTPSPDGPVFRPRSPRQLIAVYDDPSLDAWPQFAFEEWITQKDAKTRRVGRLYDDTFIYDLDLGEVHAGDGNDRRTSTSPASVVTVLDVTEHGGTHAGRPVCPVVRFVNSTDAEGQIVGEVAPLIGDQRALNEVNFDRLIVSRWGANPQRVISGWTGTRDEVLKSSAMRVWTFGDDKVKAQAFPAASVEPYNSVLSAMLEHIAMKAQISPAQVTGKMVNVTADALAAAEANQQRKLKALREAFGEALEQMLQLGAAMDGDVETAEDSGAEVLWRDTEARSFGAVVDGITKLYASDVPIVPLLPMLPGVTQQMLTGIKDEMKTQGVTKLVDKLTAAAPPAPPEGAAAQAGAAADDDAPDVPDEDDEAA